MSIVFQQRRVAVDTVTWTALTAIMNCQAVSLRNLGVPDMKIRTTAASAATEDVLGPLEGKSIDSPSRAGHEYTDYRFHAGDIIVYAQAAAGTGPVLVSCLG